MQKVWWATTHVSVNECLKRKQQCKDGPKKEERKGQIIGEGKVWMDKDEGTKNVASSNR